MNGCPGCGAEVDDAARCPSCGREQFDAPPPPPSDWLPGAPLHARGSPSDPLVSLVAKPRRNKTGCGCGLVAIVTFFVVLGTVISAVVWVGREVTEAVVDPFGGGDDVAGDPLTLDRPVDGHVGDDDTGVHRLTGIEGRVTISVAGGPDFDPVLRVEDAGGALLGENDDADGLDSRLSLILSTSDDLRVRVREFGGDAGDYTVAVLRGDEVVGIPPIDAGSLTVRTESEGQVGRNQAAAYRFTGEGNEVVVEVRGVDGFDPLVRVLDGNGKEIGRDDDSGEGFDSRLELLVPGATHVTIEVTGYGGEAGRYRIVVR